MTSRASALSLLGWSWRMGELWGVEYRLSLLLIFLIVSNAWQCAADHQPILIPIAVIVPLLAVFLHFCGHLLALRWVGGHANSTIMTIFGDQTEFYGLPLRWWPQFIAPAAGIIASALVWILCGFAANVLSSAPPLQVLVGRDSLSFAGPARALGPLPLVFLRSLSGFSCGLMLWNLLPIMTLDGARMWRTVLWPFLGLRRAVSVTIMSGLVLSVLLIVYGLTHGVMIMVVLLGVCFLIIGIAEFRSMQGGYDLVLQLEPALHGGRRLDLWGRWQQSRDRRRQEREEREITDEQVVLDRLLAKVAAHGLPSLSAKERAILGQISKRQQQRQGT